MIDIKLASELGEDIREKVSELFVDGFGKNFAFFSKDEQKLAKAFAHIFVLDVFYIAMIEGDIVGMTACTDGKTLSVRLNKHELRKYLGLYKGTLAYIFLKSEFEKSAMETGEKKASVEFVVTASKYRGNGVATTLMNYIINLPQYDEFILEVADTNESAVQLYGKLGYKEFTRVKQKFSKISGVNYLVYMKNIKQGDNADSKLY
ncbi:GNAT family N-acetyltransferase [Bacillus sp. FSL R9-9410]|uniref:GNAT family N-acetyltransferase n=1 Tax=Bacillus sp. FSL R9-9410 TaxID=2921590 RepID=UPI003101211C